jgi:tetratricopeptide (TPR) repeat protein
MNLGHALEMLGRTEESISVLRAATQVDPQRTTPEVLARAHLNLGAALGRQGDFEAAIIEYEHAVRLHPGYEKAHYSLGWLLAREGRLNEAVEHYRRVLQIDPNHQAARQALDDTLERLQRSRPD